MPHRRVALALPLLLACSGPAAPPKPDVAAKASAKPEPTKPPRKLDTTARKSPKIDPPAELQAKDVPPAPTLTSITLTASATGTLPLPEGIGVVLPHVALQLEQGLLVAGQAYVDYDPKIRATEIWQFQAFVPTTGEPRSSKGESGSIRAGMLDGKGGAVLVGSLGVGLAAHVWAGKVGADGAPAGELALANPGYSDAFSIVGGGPKGELAVLAGFADTVAWMQSIDDAGSKRWQPTLEADGFTQLRALARIEGQALLGVGTVAQREGEAWWVRVPADGNAAAQGKVDALEGATPAVDGNRTMVALIDRGEAGLIGLGLAKRGIVQDHDQVFVVGFDRKGEPRWARAIEQVRAKQVRGALGWQGAGLFVLEVPVGEGTAIALLRIAGPDGAEVRVEQIAGSEGRRSAGFVQGVESPELLIADTAGTLGWQRMQVSP
ncbi:hypothetical protein ACNOYE_00595 [Nannocystaceae bacterium ST9]